MYDLAIDIKDLGKMYKLFNRSADKLLNAFGFDKLIFFNKKKYKEFWALRDLNLQIGKGERVGIIGRNGAGKSTLLKIICGNVTPTEGIAQVNGRIQALMEIGTGFHPEFTGRQNIHAALSYYGLPVKRITELEEEIIDFSELEDFIDQPVKTYSAGMYARLAFSVATSIKPEILIIDEVLGAGDAYFAGKCVERMRKLTNDSEATVLFVSHDLGSVQALCDRVIWIDRGTVRADGEPLEVIKQYSAMIRQEDEIRLKARDLKISKKQAAIVERKQDLFQTFLFRFVGKDGGHPQGKHKIRSVCLLYGDKELSRINVGAPMDDSPDYEHHILVEPGFMDWGPAEKDSQGYYRCFGNYNGKYAHAPFQFLIPKGYLTHAMQLSLVVEACTQQDPINVELYDQEDNRYQPLGQLLHGERRSEFCINKIAKNNEIIDEAEVQVEIKNELEQANLGLNESEYGTREALITDVKIYDSENHESKTIFCMEQFQVELEFETKRSIKNPVFVFCIYHSTGLCVSQWIVSSSELGLAEVMGKGKIIIGGEKLIIGTGAYVASAAIFKHNPINGTEPESYHVLDRCIHFQIQNRNELERTDFGLCRQPVKVKLNVC